MGATTECKHWLKEGEPVAHITNLSFRMSIEKLLYKRAEIFCNQSDPNAFFDTNQKRWLRNKKLLVGVRCRWVNGDGMFESTDFHSRELVPWEVALKGASEVDNFRRR